MDYFHAQHQNNHVEYILTMGMQITFVFVSNMFIS